MVDARLDYISVGVNRVVNALAWGEHGGVAYAAHHMIALYDTESARVVSTICGHTGLVNCVHWVPREATPDLPPSQQLLLSGATDNTICCWLVTYPDLKLPTASSASLTSTTAAPSQPTWRRLAVLHGHTAPVTCVAVHQLPARSSAAPLSGGVTGAVEPRLLLVSTAGDSDVLVWACGGSDGSREHGLAGAVCNGVHANGASDLEVGEEVGASSLSGQEDRVERTHGSASTASAESIEPTAADALYAQSQWRLDQRIYVGTKMQTTAALAQLPGDPDWTLLATGGTDRKVHLYVRPPAGTGTGTGTGTRGSAQFTPACVLEGHENWIRGVAFCYVEGPTTGAQLLLASVSQDRYGRIWKLQPESLHATAIGSASGAESTAPLEREDPLTALIQRYAPKPHVDTSKTRYVATCEALLIGHEDWVHGLQWAPPPSAEEGSEAGNAGALRRRRAIHTRSTAALLTASMDRTMVIWKFEADSGLWMNEASLGDAGASCLGYFGGVWGPGGAAILAHGFTGALHLWKQSQPLPGVTGTGSSPWLPHHALGGHFGAVVDLGWGLDGGCLISVAEDQTARVHAGVVWRHQREAEGGGEERQQQQLHWCEVARAQVHGHDFRCVTPVANPPGGPYVYVSGSEEKVLRVLESPQTFIDTLVALRGGEDSPAGRTIRAERRMGHGFGASIAALGLSNKAVDVSDETEGGTNAGLAGGGSRAGDYMDGPDFVPCAAPQVVREPPLEEHLAQNTLWPETHKLYGHGNDVFCTAASPDGRYLASACKAQTATTASIWVWCTSSWRAVAQLRAHTLTVTQLEWSPSSSFLAAASRDRTFSIFQRCDAAPAPGQVEASGGSREVTFELVSRVKSAHGRVIWSVSWSLDEQLIATASRDDTVKVWRTGRHEAVPTPTAPVLATMLPQFPYAATAVAFAPRLPAAPPVLTGPSGSGSSSGSSAVGTAGERYVLAVGLENGSVQIWQVAASTAAAQGPPNRVTASCLWSASEPWRHVAAVRRLRWRGAPGTATAVRAGEESATASVLVKDVEKEEGRVLQLASGSEDHSVRVFTFSLGDL